MISITKYLRFGGHTVLAWILLSCTSACTSTAEIEHAWVNPELSSKDLSGTLVVAISRDPKRRQAFEQIYVDELTAQGVRAKASFQIGKDEIKAEDVLAFAQQHQLDTVLVTSYAGTSENERYKPGTVYYRVAPGAYYGNFNSYYGHVYEVGRTQSYYTTHNYLMLVSTLYETSSKEVLWKASSTALQGGDPENLFSPFIDSFVEQMKKDGLVR